MSGGAKKPRLVHEGTSKVFELIPLETLRQIQKRWPIARRIKREV